MKTLSIIFLFASLATQAQVSADVGFISRGHFQFGATYQHNYSYLYGIADTHLTDDNIWPITGLQIGIGTNKERDLDGWLRGDIILSGGIFFHSGIWVPTNPQKTEYEKKQKLLFGASFQYQHWYRMPVKIQYNGETVAATIGFLFYNR